MEPQAPGADSAPATPPAGEPAAPATPPVTPPAEPAAPAAPPATEPTADEVEAQEWDDAADEIFPGIKAKREQEEGKKPNEPAKPAEEPKAPEAPKEPDAPAKPAEDGAEPDEADDEENEGEEPEFDTARADARRAERAERAEFDAVKADVKKQLYPNLPTTLADADGDPINGIEDVMKLINPRTNEPFTEEEAGMWLLSAQQQFNQRIELVNKEVERIADIYVQLQDETRSITYRYGALLKEMPDLATRLWTRYQNTLVKDEKSGIILSAPVSLEEYYETALEPYAKLGRDAEAQQNAEAEAKAKAEAEAKAQQEAEDKKKRERQDRSDIYGGGSKDDPSDPDDKEWGEAIDTVFGDDLRRRNQGKK